MKQTRSLTAITTEIRKDWVNMPPAARAYFVPMSSLDTVNDNYGWDSGRSIVRYFLANAGTWRGEVARRVKAELKEMVK